MMFSDQDLRKLLLPLIAEQVLTSMMGIVDTMMVSNVGSAAVAGVSLVDSINKLVLFLFLALATGGTIVCSQYLGRRDKARSDRAARQVMLSALVLGLAVMAVCLAVRRPLLRLIFGTVEPAVMTAAETYFRITALYYPFIALFNAGAALYRASGKTRLPMIISVSCNGLNVIGNAVTMFVLGMGVKGAAISTTVSVAIAAVVMLICLRRPHQAVEVGPLHAIRPDFRVIWMILSVGIPTGVENVMFQMGKLAVQSTVSTLGTAAIAANAIVIVIEYLTSMPSKAIGLGLITVSGQCMGAGHVDQAKYYIKKLTLWSTVVLAVTNWAIFFLTKPICRLAGMEADAMALTVSVMLVISIWKPFLWPFAFVPVDGMRAAGDVRFSMVVCVASMWILRVALTTVCCRVFGMGLLGVWYGYFADWLVRGIVFALRFRSGKWAEKKVI